MARNWRTALRPASFRGVPFWVESDDTDGVGRRVVVHEPSGAETHLSEDLGQTTRMAFVAAYVVGDIADAQAHALETACAAPGAALLALPIDMPRQMHCLSCRRSRHRDRAGYIAYDLEFVLAGTGAASTQSGLGQLRDIFLGGVAAVSSVLGRLAK